MKKLISILLAGVAAMTLSLAQTPQEIVARMDEVMNRADSEKIGFTMDMKIPFIGTFSTTALTWGEKMRMEGKNDGKHIITWYDAKTQWEYNVHENVIRIKNRAEKKEESAEEKNLKMLRSATDGYDLKLTKETDNAWYFRCKKNRSNPRKDDPKRMDLVVEKGSYKPLSMSTGSMGLTVTIRDLVFDVTEEQVTFNPSDYPDAQVIDER